MQRLIGVCILLFCFSFAEAQIKDQYVDDKNENRTVVVKEFGIDDYQILEDQFGDAEVGEVIRITTAKEKLPKPEREVIQPEPIEAEKEKPEKIVGEKVDRPVSTAPKIKAKRKSRFKPVKRKRYSKHKKYRCFSRW